jgi:hypothetical protein
MMWGMKLLNLDAAEENLLAWLIQCCLSDGLLLKSGLPPDVAEKYLAEVRTLDAKLMKPAGLLVEWTPDRPPRCREHGDLAAEPMPRAAGQLLTLEHLRDAHGKDGPELAAVIERARQAADPPLPA